MVSNRRSFGVCAHGKLGLVMGSYNEALALADLIEERCGETPCMAYPELFFPVASLSERENGQAYLGHEAKKLCQTCPVMLECADYAIRNFEVHGIWGGLAPKERQKLWRKAGIDYAKYAEN